MTHRFYRPGVGSVYAVQVNPSPYLHPPCHRWYAFHCLRLMITLYGRDFRIATTPTAAQDKTGDLCRASSRC